MIYHLLFLLLLYVCLLVLMWLDQLEFEICPEQVLQNFIVIYRKWFLFSNSYFAYFYELETTICAWIGIMYTTHKDYNQLVWAKKWFIFDHTFYPCLYIFIIIYKFDMFNNISKFSKSYPLVSFPKNINFYEKIIQLLLMKINKDYIKYKSDRIFQLDAHAILRFCIFRFLICSFK